MKERRPDVGSAGAGFDLLVGSERSRRPADGDSRRSDTVVWWHLATAIDILHFPIVIALVVVGAAWFSGPTFFFLLTLMVVLQVATLGCPVMWLTGQLRQVHDPDYEVRWSFTAWLYHRYGKAVGIGVFVALAALTLTLRWLLF
ncbi:MAG: hypothetical protein QNJ12_03495 [Ilumatobacter sp.]|uniref:hypothetical protein n=1 Tax=Ilumatobacter sp. TaxID=1967498 RepID=UPI00261D0C4F|nr:hypothetical protein [Ilumatobacter sp.]MDJ0767826.1 hypothetical protein [Ilumatobacter sp.]